MSHKKWLLRTAMFNHEDWEWGGLIFIQEYVLLLYSCSKLDPQSYFAKPPQTHVLVVQSLLIYSRCPMSQSCTKPKENHGHKGGKWLLFCVEPISRPLNWGLGTNRLVVMVISVQAVPPVSSCQVKSHWSRWVRLFKWDAWMVGSWSL